MTTILKSQISDPRWDGAPALLLHLESLANTPDAVPKLRDLILNLAVRGRLCPPDAQLGTGKEAESSLELAARLEKARLCAVAEGLAPKQKPPSVTEAERFFDSPKHWVWMRLDQLGWFAGGATPSMANPKFWDGEVPWVTPKDMKAPIIEVSAMSVTRLALEKTRLRRFPKNSILIVARSGILKRTLPVSVSAIECTVNQDLKVIVPFLTEIAPFVRLMLRGHERYILEHLVKGGMTVQSLKYSEFEEQAFPLPPLPEQRRIVAKVEELLSFCDELEARQTTARENRTRLVHSALDHLTAAKDEPDFRNRASFILHKSPFVLEEVPALRQAILSLAVQGHLVPQDPSDEPATDLLNRLRKKHERNASELPMASKPIISQLLPLGWAWARFSDLGEFARGKSKHRPRNDPVLYRGGKYPLVQTGDVARANSFIGTFTGLYNEIGLAQSRLWPVGTLCITIAANIADAAILGIEACFPDSIVGFIPDAEVGHVRYFEFFMKTAKERLQDFAPSTAQKNINVGILDTVLIPLPPAAEQARIVAKVEGLMLGCDELETQLATADIAGSHLLDAILSQVLNGACDATNGKSHCGDLTKRHNGDL